MPYSIHQPTGLRRTDRVEDRCAESEVAKGGDSSYVKWPTFVMDVGQKIRAACEVAGTSPTQLAVRVGMAQATSRRMPSSAMVERILDAARPRPSVVLAANRQGVLDLATAHGAESALATGTGGKLPAA